MGASRALSIFCALAIVVPFALAGNLVAKDVRTGDTLPQGWRGVPLAGLNGQSVEFHPITVAIKLTNTAALEEKFWAVSDPQSALYGKHLSRAEIAKIVPACEGCVERVLAWLGGMGAVNVKVTPDQGFVKARVPVAALEAGMNVSLCGFTHANRPDLTIHRACGLGYYVPADIAESIDFVSNLARLPRMPAPVKIVGRTDAIGNSPAAVRTLYNIPQDLAGNSTKGMQGVGAFLDQWYSKKDLEKFWETYVPKIGKETIVVHGPNADAAPGVEANLDIQYITAIGAGIETFFWSNDDFNPVNHQEPWTEFFANISTFTNPPQVFSASYGDDEYTLTKDYTDRVNTELQKLGTQGITIIVASGDSGAGCHTGRFEPTFPATSPYLTSVGATGGKLLKQEAASFSSGGFSDFYPAPSYQVSAVQRYLETARGLPNTKLYNITGRAFPDVAAVGESVPICYHGVCGMEVAGTSCASPIFAGVISLINDFRLSNGKSTLGFLNLALYQNAGILQDITTGVSQGCGANGWPAAVGWDAVTGLGSPNYPIMANVLGHL